jgi:hypothetical protein
MLRSQSRPVSPVAALGDFDVVTGPPAPPRAQVRTSDQNGSPAAAEGSATPVTEAPVRPPA